MKATYPIKLHALSPEEILHLCRLESLPLETVLERLVAAGLDSLARRRRRDPRRSRAHARSPSSSAPASQWLEVMRVGHRLGLRSTATMMFGFGETLAERVEHL